MSRRLLLTGATGLLGSWLIRDLLLRGRQFAILVRPKRVASGRERIEQILQAWERRVGYALPRPQVIEGDLRAPQLGVTSSDREWIAAHCDTVLHSAASLTFEAKSDGAEPWLTNVNGVQHLLEFCRSARIRHFHHVSTAYVCGLRSGRVFENELDVGQERGNDYELSKAEAERMVRAADFFETRTIYRPGIIFGDSRTGFTTTFHGLYVPLKVISILLGHGCIFGLTPDQLRDPEVLREASSQLIGLMGLTGDERKNLVPVDWVSAVIAQILDRPECHGRTYHLTPPHPVTVATIQQAIMRAFSRNITAGTGHRFADPAQWGEFQEQYLEQMAVYRSYWRDDPEFDTSNVTSAAPHQPCPPIDSAMLERTCQFALRANFCGPRLRRLKTEEDVQQILENRVSEMRDAATDTPDCYLGLTVNGVGGGEWNLAFQGPRLCSVSSEHSDRVTTRAYMNSWTFHQLRTGQLTADAALAGGRLVLEGSLLPEHGMTSLVESLAAVTEARGQPQI